ncbi:complement component 1 Q subcomponent-binding protein, mitochondrial-like [Drosophila pseudoobscura]|uniref:Complement component 1 Q subcomponent-binding protein, mitochondrial-like n=1 Tax=Drosophila pseudoobscura pseudoobscura TaxID=46245 RepID=A0A6I8VWW4_DROPS|nr:complement component 1 Q subcomponent-binding protein, mitochondrial [Drosophila pseudoobscura]
MSRLIKALQMFPRALAKCGLSSPPVTIQRRTIALSFWPMQKDISDPVLDQLSSEDLTALKISPARRNLVCLLATEMIAERLVKQPFECMNGFEAVFCGSEVKLIKEGVVNPVNIIFNVSKSMERGKDKGIGQLSNPFRIMPNFDVRFPYGNTLLSIHCKFLSEAFKDGAPLLQEHQIDVFEIQAMSLFEKEDTYTVKANMIDDNLYWAVMDFLADQGITNEFAIKLSDFSTFYEHDQYIRFLENLSKFVVPPPPVMERYNTDDSSN